MDKRQSEEAVADSLVAAANFVKRGARAILARGEKVGAVTAERDSLVQWAKIRGKIVPQSYCHQFHHIGGGAEHEVYLDLDRSCAVKTTHPNGFGWSVLREGASATPFEYLRRLVYQNWFFGDNIKILGVSVEDDHMSVITTQPWIYKSEKSAASEDEIDRYFFDLGFLKSGLIEHGGFFYHPLFNIVAADAHSRNVLISVEGAVIPIDVVMGKPGDELGDKLRKEFSLPADAATKVTATANTTGVSYTYKAS